MRISEAAGAKIGFSGAVELEQTRIPLARGADVRVGEKINFASEARERCHDDAARYRGLAAISAAFGIFNFEDQFGEKNRIGEIGKSVIEALTGMNSFERVVVGGGVFADGHEAEFGDDQTESKDAVAEKGMSASDGFGDIEGGCAGSNSLPCECGLHIFGHGFQGKRMRQGFPGRILFERIVNAFVGLDEDEDWMVSGWQGAARW